MQFESCFGGLEVVGCPDFVKESVPDTIRHTKKTSGQTSDCVQREDRKWKYQKMDVFGGSVYKCSWVQSSSQELRQLQRREESLYCMRESIGSQWREARWAEMWSVLRTLRTHQIGDLSFHGQVAVKCNTNVLDRVRQRNRCTTLSDGIWEEETDVDFLPENTIIASVLSSGRPLF